MEAFSGDTYLAEHFLSFGVDTVIETGTYKGQTTEWLAEHFKRVITIESNPAYFKNTKNRLKNKNIEFVLGDSAKELPKILSRFNHSNFILFLDAHWYENPLLGELKAVKESGLKPIIIIHDFKVPGKDFGFDTYPGIVYDWDYIKDAIYSIYGSNFVRVYNSEATGARRGVITIT